MIELSRFVLLAATSETNFDLHTGESRRTPEIDGAAYHVVLYVQYSSITCCMTDRDSASPSIHIVQPSLLGLCQYTQILDLIN